VKRGLFNVGGTDPNNKHNFTTFLIPGATLMSHSTKPAQLGWAFVGEGDFFAAFSRGEIDEGEEVFMKYGDQPNAKLMASYGIMVENNPAEELPITLDAKDTKGLQKRKEELLKIFNLPRAHTLRFGNLSKYMLPSSRIIAAKVGAFESLHFKHDLCRSCFQRKIFSKSLKQERRMWNTSVPSMKTWRLRTWKTHCGLS
jgi:hypothetical protein